MRSKCILLIATVLSDFSFAASFTTAQAPVRRGCFSSREEAARSVVDASTSSSRQGYRAGALVIDPVLHRAWLRIEDCAHPERTSSLIPLDVSFTAGPAQASSLTSAPSLPANLPVPTFVTPLIPGGQPVQIAVTSDAAQMQLHGRTLWAARIGSAVDVVLDSAPDEERAPQRMHGRLISATHVEVRA